MQNIIDGENSSGPWTGIGAQKAAWAFGPLALMTVSPGKRREYWAARTLEARDDLVHEFTRRKYEVNERVDGTRPARPSIDYDGPPNSDETLDRLIEVFHTVARTYGIPPEYATPNVSVSDRLGKLSAHLVADEWTLRDGAQIKAFQVAVKKEMGAAGSTIDIIANGSSYGLRVVGSPKHGVSDAELVVERGPRTLNYHYLQGEDNMFDVDRTSTDKPSATGAAVQSTGLRAHVDEFRKAVASRFEYLEEGPESAGCLSWLRTAPAFCTVCLREHDTDNAFSIVTADGTGLLFCRRAHSEGTKTPLFRHEIKRPDDDPVLAAARATCGAGTAEPKTELIPDTFDSILAHSDAREVCEQYCSDVFKSVVDALIDYYLCAPWGSGKTYAYCLRIRMLLKHDPDAVVMLISCRKTLTAQICKDTGAISYTEIKGYLDPKANPLTVWQVDSLTRVDLSKLTRLDLLIIDESMMLASHVFGGAQPAARPVAGTEILRQLVQKTRRLLVCDNDLSASQVQMFQTQRPAGTKSAVLRNMIQPWKGRTAKVHRSSASAETLLLREAEEQEELRSQGKKWHGIAVACHTKKLAESLYERLAARYSPAYVHLYTGDTSDKIKAADFSDATAAWADAQIVIYTSTASVGISCNLPHFTSCYAFFNASGNAGVNQSAQMLFRMRHTTKWTIAVEGSSVHRSDSPCTPEDLFTSCCAHAAAREQIPNAYRNDRTEAVMLKTSSDPGELATFVNQSFGGTMWLGARMELNRSYVDFVGRLTRLLSGAGLGVTNEAASAVAMSEKRETRASRREAEERVARDKAETGVEGVPAYLARDPVCALALGLPVPDDVPLTAPQRLAKDVVVTARTYGVDPLEVTPDWYLEKQPYVKQYLRLKRYRRKTIRERGALENGSERTAGELLEQALKAAGFSLDDPPNKVVKIDAGNVKLRDVIRELNTRAFTLYGDKNGRRRNSKEFTSRTIASSLSAALSNHFGGEIVGLRLNNKKPIDGYMLRWKWRGAQAPYPHTISKLTHTELLEILAKNSTPSTSVESM